MFLLRTTVGGGARHFKVVQKLFFSPFFHLSTVSSLIFDAESESVVRFEIGPAEVPFCPPELPFDPLPGPLAIFSHFSLKVG